MVLSGFTWPTAVPNTDKPADSAVSSGAGTPEPTTSAGPAMVSSAKAPEATETAPGASSFVSIVPIPPTLASQSGNSAAETTHVQLTLTQTVNPPSTSDKKAVGPSISVPTLSPESDNPQTTHVQVTSTVTAQPVPTVEVEAAISSVPTPCSHSNGHILGSEGLLKTRVKVTNTITFHSPAPELPSGISFQLAEPPSGLPPRQTAKSAESTNNAAIAGGILGGIIGVVLLLVLIRWLQKRTAYLDVEHARAPRHHAQAPLPQSSSKDIVMGRVGNYTVRRSPILDSDDIDPVALAQANGWQHNFAAHRSPSLDSDNIDRVALAQAIGWQHNFAANNFELTPVRGGGQFPGPQYPPAQVHVRDERRAGPEECSVSPLSLYGQPYAGHGQHDVSPLASSTLGWDWY